MLQMLEARSGQHKQIRALMAQLTSTPVTSAEVLALETRVLLHLDWRLGPYFAPDERVGW